MNFTLPSRGIARLRATRDVLGPGLASAKRRRLGAGHVGAIAALTVAVGSFTALMPAKADAGVQRIELSAVPDQRAAQLAGTLSARQSFLTEVAALANAPWQAFTPPAEARVPVARAAEVSLALIGAVQPERIAADQFALAEALRQSVDDRASAAETAIRRVGLNPRLLTAKTGDRSSQGGPLIGDARGLGLPFERLASSLARMEALEDGLAAVPHNLPARLEYISSGFGYRSDPFTGAPALHSGLDFRGPIGAPIYAAAKGRVSFAGVREGYGNCLEIDHGNGLSTRYAHMSAFRARVGQPIDAGDVIGAIGSTGRSTGPHLHFEVRINDQAVNPRPFLEAQARAGR